VLLALNTYPQAANPELWRRAVDRAADLRRGRRHPGRPRPDGYAANRTTRSCACTCRCRARPPTTTPSTSTASTFGIQRAVLPRVLSLTQVEQVIANTPVEIEVFGFGSLCVMVEGRCALSAYATGESPNTHGVCSPPRPCAGRKRRKGVESRLNGVLIDRYARAKTPATPRCARAALTWDDEKNYYAIEEPTSLNTLELLPQLMKMGVRDQDRRPPAQPGLRGAGHQGVARGHRPLPGQPAPLRAKPAWMASLDKVAEGQQHTLGAYHRPWK
jgi:hypothetical protein